MRRMGLALSLALLVVIVYAYEVPAQSWELIYTCDKFPDDPALGDDIWTVFRTDGIESSDIGELNPAGEFHLTDPDNMVTFYMRPHDDLSNTTMEARVKVISQDGVWYTCFMEIMDGANTIAMGLFPDHITVSGIGDHFLDMTEYHVLRIAKTDGDAIIYVDDEQVLEGHTDYSDDRHSPSFGAGSTGGAAEHYWDYVAYTTKGAFSPEELSNLLAVESEGKVATCWGTLKYQ